MQGDDWRWCPCCRAELDHLERGDAPRPHCSACGFLFFANMGVGAAVVVRNDAGQVLLVQRASHQYGAGQWCFPCGFVEWGEDVRVAAAREAKEEAGLDVELGDVVQVRSNFHQPEKPTIGVWFSASRLDPTQEPTAGDDAVAVGWFDPLDPPDLAFPTDIALLRKIA